MNAKEQYRQDGQTRIAAYLTSLLRLGKRFLKQLVELGKRLPDLMERDGDGRAVRQLPFHLGFAPRKLSLWILSSLSRSTKR